MKKEKTPQVKMSLRGLIPGQSQWPTSIEVTLSLSSSPNLFCMFLKIPPYPICFD